MSTLCTTADSVSQAVQVLSNAGYVILDCEGRNLGCSVGALSLIVLGTPHASHVYIFDVLAIPQDALQLLFDTIISSTSKTKVVWDGRMDYIELFASYACPIENLLDLQLADVLSHAKRGHTQYQHLGRFARRDFPPSEVRKVQLDGVHVLINMDMAIKEHKIKGFEAKSDLVKNLHTLNLSDAWMQRPLMNELLAYATGDIKKIAGIYDHFLKCGFLEPIDHLREISSLYVSIYRQTGRPEQSDTFIMNPFLPVSIPLETPSENSGLVTQEERQCTGCKRMIPEHHFPVNRVASEASSRSPMCKDDEELDKLLALLNRI